MATSQLHFFVTKFASLWAYGQDVNLTFNSKHIKAYVNMQVELGEFKTVNDNIKINEKVSYGAGLSRQRRREKRSSYRDVTISAEKAVPKVEEKFGITKDIILLEN